MNAPQQTSSSPSKIPVKKTNSRKRNENINSQTNASKITLAKVKAGNTIENSKNDTCQLIYF